MTNKERLISLIGNSPGDASLEGVLLDAGITGIDTYNSSLQIPLKKCAIELLYLLLSTPDQVTLNGMNSKKYDRDAVLKQIGIYETQIAGEIDEVKPTIRGRSVW